MPALPKPDWDEIRVWMREHFPDVRNLSVEELRAWRDDPRRSPPLLMDIRASAEQAVSCIAGAQLSRTEAEAIEMLAELRRDTPIVAYCAVGVRSAKLVRALQEAGFTNVRNLEGSIQQRPAAGVRGGPDHESPSIRRTLGRAARCATSWQGPVRHALGPARPQTRNSARATCSNQRIHRDWRPSWPP